MSTVPRRAGGTTFFRHVHLKAGIEVPRARLLYMNEERCAPAAPREERGPGAPSPRLPRGHGHAVCMRMHSRMGRPPQPGTRYFVDSYATSKTRFLADNFLAEPVALC